MSNQESSQANTQVGTSEAAITDSIQNELRSFITSKSAVFTCGGAIKIIKPSVVEVNTDVENPANNDPSASATAANTPNGEDNINVEAAPTSSPISIRWDSQDPASSMVSKIVFPLEDAAGVKQLATMIQDCEPASFGFQGKDVVDESYRKAIKMDNTAFSTDFCPYKLGIIDTIAQMLLPNTEKCTFNGIRAELYKLNIYGAPVGFFKSHVDTPRSETQFGSLVVSLPCHHEGGQLVVRHKGHSQTFDWSTSKAGKDNISWAAFYSDCEHEVLNLYEGYRVTLTYNLFHAPGVGDLAKLDFAMDVKHLPLYKVVSEALANPKFMVKGGNLGVYCSHAYAHTTKVGASKLPATLKGVDMALFVVFRALGLEANVHAIPEKDPFYDEYEYEELRAYNKSENLPSPRPPPPPPSSRVGDIGAVHVNSWYEVSYEEYWQKFPHVKKRIHWLTPVYDHGSLGYFFLTYGNNVSCDYLYTHAALIVEIPPTENRVNIAM